MNVPPESGIRVPAEDMRVLVRALFKKAGTSEEDAGFMAGLLVETDLRGVFSHGTGQTPTYVSYMLEGQVNPRPRISLVKETPTTRVYDGDGGMGHMPTYRAMEWAVERARELGVAAATTRNHHHFGAAGKYSRLALEGDCIGLAVSSHRYPLERHRRNNIMGASGGSPFSIAIPAGEEPPLVPDMGTGFGWDEDIFAQYPWIYFKSLGLGATMKALGGILAGIEKPEFKRPISKWEANQGAFVAAFSIDCFMPVEEFKVEMDRYIGAARRLAPLPGQDRAELAGGLEWLREQEYARDGIPLSDGTRQGLEDIAGELGVETPFARWEHTRFGA